MTRCRVVAGRSAVGGAGADRFVGTDAAGTARILDFDGGEGDVIDLSAYGIADFAGVQARVSPEGPSAHDSRITLDSDTVVIPATRQHRPRTPQGSAALAVVGSASPFGAAPPGNIAAAFSGMAPRFFFAWRNGRRHGPPVLPLPGSASRSAAHRTSDR